eukprot:764867-Hanusia_phi.AAC.11
MPRTKRPASPASSSSDKDDERKAAKTEAKEMYQYLVFDKDFEIPMGDDFDASPFGVNDIQEDEIELAFEKEHNIVRFKAPRHTAEAIANEFHEQEDEEVAKVRGEEPGDKDRVWHK